MAVSTEITQQLLDYFEQSELLSLLSIHFYINDQLYVREITKETENYAQRCGVTPIPLSDLPQVLSKEPTKVLALCDDGNLIQALLGNLRLEYTPV